MKGGSCFSEETFFLKKEDLFSSGSERDCYLLPEHKSLCVKIQHGREGKYGQNIEEYKYYKRLVRRGIDWSRIARCYGWVETNLGRGLVFELACDPDGTPSVTFQEYMEKNEFDSEIRDELKNLKEYLLINNIVLCDLRTSNILCQNLGGRPFLKFVDGVGNRDYIKLGSWSSYWGRKKIIRHWERFEKRIERLFSDRV